MSSTTSRATLVGSENDEDYEDRYQSDRDPEDGMTDAEYPMEMAELNAGYDPSYAEWAGYDHSHGEWASPSPEHEDYMADAEYRMEMTELTAGYDPLYGEWASPSLCPSPSPVMEEVICPAFTDPFQVELAVLGEAIKVAMSQINELCLVKNVLHPEAQCLYGKLSSLFSSLYHLEQIISVKFTESPGWLNEFKEPTFGCLAAITAIQDVAKKSMSETVSLAKDTFTKLTKLTASPTWFNHLQQFHSFGESIDGYSVFLQAMTATLSETRPAQLEKRLNDLRQKYDHLVNSQNSTENLSVGERDPGSCSPDSLQASGHTFHSNPLRVPAQGRPAKRPRLDDDQDATNHEDYDISSIVLEQTNSAEVKKALELIKSKTWKLTTYSQYKFFETPSCLLSSSSLGCPHLELRLRVTHEAQILFTLHNSKDGTQIESTGFDGFCVSTGFEFSINGICVSHLFRSKATAHPARSEYTLISETEAKEFHFCLSNTVQYLCQARKILIAALAHLVSDRDMPNLLKNNRQEHEVMIFLPRCWRVAYKAGPY